MHHSVHEKCIYYSGEQKSGEVLLIFDDDHDRCTGCPGSSPLSSCCFHPVLGLHPRQSPVLHPHCPLSHHPSSCGKQWRWGDLWSADCNQVLVWPTSLCVWWDDPAHIVCTKLLVCTCCHCSFRSSSSCKAIIQLCCSESRWKPSSTHCCPATVCGSLCEGNKATRV